MKVMCPQFPLCNAECDEEYVTDKSEAKIKHRNFSIVRYPQRNEPLRASKLEEQDTILTEIPSLTVLTKN